MVKCLNCENEVVAVEDDSIRGYSWAHIIPSINPVCKTPEGDTNQNGY